MNIFNELKASLEEAIEIKRGRKKPTRVTCASDHQVNKKRTEKARLATLEELSALDQDQEMGYE